MHADVRGMACSHYHAAMTQQEREEVQANWTHDRMQIIVATIAFGMGQHAPSVSNKALLRAYGCSTSCLSRGRTGVQQHRES